MNCPVCHAWTSVNATRSKPDAITRRRECANGHTFSTLEQIIPSKCQISALGQTKTLQPLPLMHTSK
jgi:transcriptional regulator NrdR family protein